MAFQSFSSISDNHYSGSKRRGRPNGKKSLSYGSAVGGVNKDKERRRAVSIRLTRELAKEARILPGDRVDILFDKEAMLGLVKRVTKGGYAASVAGIKTEKLKQGEFYPVIIKMTRYAGMPFIDRTEECANVNVSNEGVLFDLPRGVKFD